MLGFPYGWRACWQVRVAVSTPKRDSASVRSASLAPGTPLRACRQRAYCVTEHYRSTRAMRCLRHAAMLPAPRIAKATSLHLCGAPLSMQFLIICDYCYRFSWIRSCPDLVAAIAAASLTNRFVVSPFAEHRAASLIVRNLHKPDLTADCSNEAVADRLSRSGQRCIVL